MILVKSESEIELMSEGGKITGGALKLAEESIEPGMTTKALDSIIEKYIKSHGAKPSFKNYNGFPSAACISVNEVIVHGIPGSRVLQEGDIVSVDIGSYYKGFHTDAARTFAVGKVTEEAEKLIRVTQESFFEGIKYAMPGLRIGDIGSHVQQHAEKNGFSVVRDMVGHGVGRALHEAPDVPNYGREGHGIRLMEGMCIAVEPMINQGTYVIKTLSDGWTTVTSDGKLSAHYENTIAILKDGPVILTLI
ncbi:MAG: type I methionyl aminopeptidase [Bacillota bacterium]|nr:type I methionyl aminopeptidase [Bacillota bacterium]